MEAQVKAKDLKILKLFIEDNATFGKGEHLRIEGNRLLFISLLRTTLSGQKNPVTVCIRLKDGWVIDSLEYDETVETLMDTQREIIIRVENTGKPIIKWDDDIDDIPKGIETISQCIALKL